MRFFNFFEHKCEFCKGTDNLLKICIPMYSGYSDWFYHNECLYKVLENPVENRKVLDMALEIANWIDTEKKAEKQRIEEATELLKRLK